MSTDSENAHASRPDWVIGTTRHGTRFHQQAGGASDLLVFINGHLDDSEVWHEVIERVDLPGWEMTAVDLRGRPSHSDAPATLDAYCEESLDVLAELRSEPSRPVVIGGHSTGGQVAGCDAAVPRHRSRVTRPPAIPV